MAILSSTTTFTGTKPADAGTEGSLVISAPEREALAARMPAPALLYLLRTTRYLPRLRGLSFLLRCYRSLFPAGAYGRIDDFDGDLSLDVNVCETIGINLWHAPKVYERLERKLFLSALRPGGTVLDVGANIGIYSLLASKRGARVIAIEADPTNAQALRQNLERNRLTDRVHLYEMAAPMRQRPSPCIETRSIAAVLQSAARAAEWPCWDGPSIPCSCRRLTSARWISKERS